MATLQTMKQKYQTRSSMFHNNVEARPTHSYLLRIGGAVARLESVADDVEQGLLLFRYLEGGPGKCGPFDPVREDQGLLLLDLVGRHYTCAYKHGSGKPFHFVFS